MLLVATWFAKPKICHRLLQQRSRLERKLDPKWKAFRRTKKSKLWARELPPGCWIGYVSRKVIQWEPPIWHEFGLTCICKQGAEPHFLHCLFQWKSLQESLGTTGSATCERDNAKGAGRSWGVACFFYVFLLNLEGDHGTILFVDPGCIGWTLMRKSWDVPVESTYSAIVGGALNWQAKHQEALKEMNRLKADAQLKRQFCFDFCGLEQTSHWVYDNIYPWIVLMSSQKFYIHVYNVIDLELPPREKLNRYELWAKATNSSEKSKMLSDQTPTATDMAGWSSHIFTQI